MLTALVLGAGIGFVAGVSPGPVLTLVVAETLRGGWPRGAAVAAGPLLADGPIVLVSLVLVGRLPRELEPALSVLGAVFLAYLAVTTLVASRRARPAAGVNVSARGGLLTGLAARALSPNPYLFWFLVGAPLLLQLGTVPAAAAFLVGYYATIVGSNVALALALHRWLAVVSDRVYQRLLLLASAILAVYAAVLFSRGLRAR